MKEEILPINFLRFLAAFGVLCVHKFTTLVDLHYLPKLFGFLAPLSSYGYLGVNLFFLISGFVITLSSEGRTFGQFISARFVRLFPVFWICVSITSLFALFLDTSTHISLFQYLTNLTMVPRMYSAYPFIDGSYWTLEVELRFYFAIALILLLRTVVTISLQKLAFLLSFPILYLALYFNPYIVSTMDIFFIRFLYYFGAEYAQYFIAGILFYGLYKNNKSYYHYIALSICYVVAVLQALDHGYISNSPAIIMIHITLFFGLFLAISLKKLDNNTFAFFGKNYRKTLITLGAVTYPLYLLHSRITDILLDTFTTYGISTSIAGPLLLIILVVLILLVNKIDFHVNSLWKQSSIIKKRLSRFEQTWLHKVL